MLEFKNDQNILKSIFEDSKHLYRLVNHNFFSSIIIIKILALQFPKNKYANHPLLVLTTYNLCNESTLRVPQRVIVTTFYARRLAAPQV